jgi:hypothetical protein
VRILGGRIMVDIRNIAGEIPGNFAQGLGDVLSRHLDAESGAKGDDWQIDTFTNDFEDEFPFDPEAPGSPYPTYGPEANLAADGKPYGDDRNNRPKVHELNQPQLAQSRGWRIVDFYPERNTKDEFYRISGTPAEIRLIIQMLRHIREIVQKFGGGDGDNTRGFSHIKAMRGWPEIKIKFYQKEKLKTGQKRPLDTLLSIALIGWSEIDKPNSKKLSISDLKQFKSKIETLFYVNKQPFILERGKEVWSYQKWEEGYANWFPAKNRQAALNVYQKLVQVKNDNFDPLAVFQGKADQEKVKYTETPQKVTVLNEEKELPIYRRTVNLEFWQAWIELPKTRQKIILVSRSNQTPVDERLTT